MKTLEKRILSDGQILEGNIIKVDSFLNHQVDPKLMKEMSEELYQLYKQEHITKILTIEASGIPFAMMCAYAFDVPLVFAKKCGSKNIGHDVLSSTVHSYTYNKDYEITVSKKYLCEDDRILIVDDFLANGAAMNGLIDIVHQSGATIVGLAPCIEKGFQDGGNDLREKGYRVTSLAIVKSIHDGKIEFQ